MMDEILVYCYFWIDYFPGILICVVTLDIGREIPLSKAAADATKFVDITIMPVEKSMGG